MENISVSVIIPIYNAERYLEQCITSVERQTLKNIEIILVNDGSSDLSAQICEKHLAKDSRIKYIYKENEGLAAARQDGIELATGQYIGFVDSDDWIEEDMYEKMYSYGFANDADVVLCNAFEYDEKKNHINLESGFYNRQKIIDEILPRTIISIDHKGTRCNIRWSNCLRIYKRATIENHNIIFDRRFRRSQDLPFTYDVMLHANGFYFTDEFLYHNRQDAGSLSRGYTVDMWKLIKPLIVHIQEATEAKKSLGLSNYMSSTAFFLALDCILNEFKLDAPKLPKKVSHIKQIITDPVCKSALENLQYEKLNSFYRNIFYRNMRNENAIKLVSDYYYYGSNFKKNIVAPILNFLTETSLYKSLRKSRKGRRQ